MTSNMSLYTLLAFILASCLQLVAGDDVNIGFEASINVTGIEIYDAYDRYNDFVDGSSLTEYTFIVPVSITRYTSTSEVITLTLFARPYDYDEDQPPEEVPVYQETVNIYDRNYYELAASFNMTTNRTDTPVYNLRAQLDIDDPNADYRQTIAGVAVLSYNQTLLSWTPHEPSVFAHQDNEASHVEYEAYLAASSEPPIDTTSETVIVDQDPDLPEDPMDDVIVEPPPEDVTTGGVPPKVDPPPGKPTTNCTCPDVPPPPPPKHCRDFHRYNKRNNDGKPWEQDPDPACAVAWKRHNDGKPKDPVCPPCAPSIHARQAATTFTTLRLKLYYGTAAAPVPIRQLQVTAFGNLDDRPLTAIGKTDNNGFASLRFPGSGSGQSVLLIYRLSVSLDAEKFRVSTSDDGGNTFLFWRWRSVPLTWEIDAGGSGEFSYRFMNKASNDVFNVQDRILTSWIFAKTKVHNFKDKLPAVYFPGNVGPNAFSPSRVFINVHPDKADASSPLAHEYGHWFHFLTRGRATLESGPDGKNHAFCQPGITSTISAFKEGYATAFGLSALWRSRFEQTTPEGGRGTAYCFWPYPATPTSQCREIENYDCDAIPVADRDLSLDEGRVAAALRDLIDLAGDNNGGDGGKGETGFSDALSGLSRRKVLYDPLRTNPTSMEEFWTNFKKVPGLTKAQIDAAWNVFEYQYAQFDK